MESESSFPHSQVSATCLYPDPERSSQCLQIHVEKLYINIILSSTLRSSIGLFPSDLLNNTLHSSFLPPYVLHAPPSPFFLIW